MTTVGQRRLGLAICPVVHLAALQEIQPILAADDYAREHNLAKHERETQADKGQGRRKRNVDAYVEKQNIAGFTLLMTSSREYATTSRVTEKDGKP